MSVIHPEWPVPHSVRAVMTTRETAQYEARALLPVDPAWLRQVHGVRVIDLDRERPGEADAAVTHKHNTVCAIQVADCMPVLLADERAEVIGAAHAGWRGLSGGVLEATIQAMNLPGARLLAWLGPAIGPTAYEVGDEVREAFMRADADSHVAFSPTRPGHWLLDIYAVARQRLRRQCVERIFGGGFCTYSDPARFHSYRRDGTRGRMAAFLWLV